MIAVSQTEGMEALGKTSQERNKASTLVHAVAVSLFLWCVFAGSFAKEGNQSLGFLEAIIPLSFNLEIAGRLHEEQGPDAAYHYLSSISALSAVSKVNLIMARAAYAAEAGRHKHAEDLYLTLISHSNPEARSVVYANLGSMLLDQTDRTLDAMLYLEKAVELHPGHPRIMSDFGWSLYRQGNLLKALKVTGDAVHLMENSPRAQKLLLNLQSLVVSQDAETSVKVVILTRYGELLWESGSRGEASEIWCDALRLDILNRKRDEMLSETLSRYDLKNRLSCR